MKSSLPVAVVLSGCGVYDGTEITEAVGLLIALSQAGFSYRCYAPVREQYHVVDHFKGAPADGARNILTESARPIFPLDVLEANTTLPLIRSFTYAAGTVPASCGSSVSGGP